MKISDNISQGSTSSDPRSEITESLKKTAVANWTTLAFPIVLVLAAILSIIFDMNIVLSFLLVIANIFSSVFIYFKIQTNQKKFIVKFRKDIAKKILQQLDPSVEYEPESYIDIRNFYSSGLFKLVPNIYKGENYIKIKEPDYLAEFSYINATKEITTINEDNSRSSSFDPVFEGIFYLFTLPVNIQGITIIRADKTNSLLDFFDEDEEKQIYGKFGKLKIIDKKFEDTFDVYSNDPDQTLQLLDEGMREKLLQIRMDNDSSLQLSIVGNYVYASLYTKNRYFFPNFILSARSKLLSKSQNDAKYLLDAAQQFKPVVGKIIMFDLLKK